ncbi:uncharacterized protein N7529_002597 [Penicillium soppii]|uniref:uncharacterized protein n=1 Tax=Penicillium soppii TaxID=69789 RepID=UPI0025497A25|nr:uncharacterized protein N7529_002597 [Penicillium soppii]KAJ5874167.1 hypothetical protein N7529_002597 [Penicillium soppii]
MSEILVVTCPGGRQCSFLFPLLYNKSKFKLHLVAHIVESTSRIQETYPDTYDISSLEDCCTLLNNATSVCHVGPSLHFREM